MWATLEGATSLSTKDPPPTVAFTPLFLWQCELWVLSLIFGFRITPGAVQSWLLALCSGLSPSSAIRGSFLGDPTLEPLMSHLLPFTSIPWDSLWSSLDMAEGNDPLSRVGAGLLSWKLKASEHRGAL